MRFLHLQYGYGKRVGFLAYLERATVVDDLFGFRLILGRTHFCNYCSGSF